MVKVTWHTEVVQSSIPVRQVYGFCFDKSGRIALYCDGGKYNLPGGRPERNEAPEETLVRECFEECRLRIVRPHYLGYQLVQGIQNEAPYAQLRFVAAIDAIEARAADPDTKRLYDRWLIPIFRFPCLVNWGIDGLLQAAAAAEIARKHLGIDPAQSRSEELIN